MIPNSATIGCRIEFNQKLAPLVREMKKTMPILILPTRYTPDTIALWKAALGLGWTAERLQSWQPPQAWKEREPVIYGEPLFAATVAKALGLALLEPPLDWLISLPNDSLNRQVRFMTLGEAKSIAGRAFIKPADDKCFPAQVYDSGTELAATAEGQPDVLPCLVAEPVLWDVEYRCIVLERRVVTLSPYLRGGELVETPEGDWPAPPVEAQEASEFAMAVLGDPAVRLPPAAVMDVGMMAGKGWSVVEANPTWSSGIYGCDATQVLAVLQRACIPQEKLTTDERHWILDRTAAA